MQGLRIAGMSDPARQPESTELASPGVGVFSRRVATWYAADLLHLGLAVEALDMAGCAPTEPGLSDRARSSRCAGEEDHGSLDHCGDRTGGLGEVPPRLPGEHADERARRKPATTRFLG